ncbi:MAG: hypothetical protein OES09_18290, partial [Gammaproteobacteria bacterium]|nr:hypothetical protein [Gammaproteobacteria bacterium]
SAIVATPAGFTVGVSIYNGLGTRHFLESNRSVFQQTTVDLGICRDTRANEQQDHHCEAHTYHGDLVYTSDDCPHRIIARKPPLTAMVMVCFTTVR